MRARRLGAPLLLAGLVAGCGSSPSGPSTVTGQTSVNAAAAQGVIGTTLAQAAGVMLGAAPDGLSRSMTTACPSGGSMTITMDFAPLTGPSGASSSSTRIEFSDCRSQTVTMNGDPYVAMTGEYVVVRGADGVTSSVTATTRMTGGVRFDVGGTTTGRARYDCTQAISMQFSNGTVLPPSITSSGTISWEQPLGTVTVRSCGA